jgi:acylphosphatase
MSASNVQQARLHAIVRGDVQGVGYRFFARREAAARGLRGWVRNRADGSVELVAEGPRPALEAFAEALRRGPPAADVEEVDCAWEAASGGFGEFAIRH